MKERKLYLKSSGRSVGSSGFVNYFGTLGPEQTKQLHEEIRENHGPCVIVDGSDNWCAKPERRVLHWAEQSGVTPVADYHSGISGISRSGIVLSMDDYPKFAAHYTRSVGVSPTENFKVVMLK